MRNAFLYMFTAFRIQAQHLLNIYYTGTIIKSVNYKNTTKSKSTF